MPASMSIVPSCAIIRMTYVELCRTTRRPSSSSPLISQPATTVPSCARRSVNTALLSPTGMRSSAYPPRTISPATTVPYCTCASGILVQLCRISMPCWSSTRSSVRASSPVPRSSVCSAMSRALDGISSTSLTYRTASSIEVRPLRPPETRPRSGILAVRRMRP